MSKNIVLDAIINIQGFSKKGLIIKDKKYGYVPLRFRPIPKKKVPTFESVWMKEAKKKCENIGKVDEGVFESNENISIENKAEERTFVHVGNVLVHDAIVKKPLTVDMKAEAEFDRKFMNKRQGRTKSDKGSITKIINSIKSRW